MKHEALIGRTIAGKYEIQTLVGQGAMGCVYKTRQTSLGTTVALKILHRNLAGEPMFAARFLREAQAASRVDHPSSMRVVDFGEEPDGLLYIAMEYVNGKTLARIIDEVGPLPVARIVDIACQALAALAVAHDIGVIHRDLKPENIMVVEGEDDEGRTHDIVKVCDFGVAKLLEGGARGPSVTAQGVVVGTPEYMSPEQARGEQLDARSDIYAMGVLLFQLMTGKVPFDSSTAFGTALMQVNDEPTRPRLLNPRVDARLERICLKAMRKRPSERHASARDLRMELRALLDEDDAYAADPGPPVSRQPRPSDDAPRTGGLLKTIDAKPRRTGLVIAGLVAVATGAAGVILFPRHNASPPPHEPVQTATITSAMMPAKPPPAPEPPQVIDTTDPGTAGADPKPIAAKNLPVMRVHVHTSARHKRGTPPLPPGAEEEIPQLPSSAPAPASASASASTSAPAKPPKPTAEKPKPSAPADPTDAPLPNFPIPPAEAP